MVHFSSARFIGKRVLRGAAKQAVRDRLEVRNRSGRKELALSVGGFSASAGIPPRYDSVGDLPL